jgi:hypothetical protein
LVLMGVRRMVPGGMPTKWKSLVDSDASRIPLNFEVAKHWTFKILETLIDLHRSLWILLSARTIKTECECRIRDKKKLQF